MNFKRVQVMLLAVFMVLPGTSLADEASKKEKAEEIMELCHMIENLDSAKSQAKAQADRIRIDVKSQLEKAFPCLPEGVWESFGIAYQRFVDDAERSYSTEEAVSVYAELYSENLSEADIDAILAFYKSPAGQKEIASVRVAAPRWQEWLIAKNNGALESAMSRFMESVQQIVEDAKKEECE